MDLNMLLFIEIQALPPSMYHKWKEIKLLILYARQSMRIVRYVSCLCLNLIGDQRTTFESVNLF